MYSSAGRGWAQRKLITCSLPGHLFWYVDDTWVKIKTQELETFTEYIKAMDNNTSSRRRMSVDIVCPSWIVQGSLKMIEASTFKYTDNRHTQINICSLTLTIHWSISWGLSELYTVGLRPCPQGQRGRNTNRIQQGCTFNLWLPELGTCQNLKKVQSSHRGKVEKRKNIFVSYVTGLSEKLRKIFRKYHIPVWP